MKKYLLLSAAFFVISAPAYADDLSHGAVTHVQEAGTEVIVTPSEGAVSDVATHAAEAEAVAEQVEKIEDMKAEAQVPAGAVVSQEIVVTSPVAAEGAPAVVHETTTVVTETAHAPALEHGHWGYSGADGAHRWASLDAAYTTCAAGGMQSPINIDKFLQEDLPDMMPAYQAGALSVVNNGHTVQVNVTAGSGMNVGGVQYELLQLHFHTPSEHYLDGAPYPMEMHLVHKAADGSLGVVSVMMKIGAHNPVIEGIWQNVPAAGSTKDVVGVELNAADLLPASLDYYKYEGSLTSPPCTEGVAWHVLKEPIELSEVQLTAFQSVFPVNARPVQPLNDRVVTGD